MTATTSPCWSETPRRRPAAVTAWSDWEPARGGPVPPAARAAAAVAGGDGGGAARRAGGGAGGRRPRGPTPCTTGRPTHRRVAARRRAVRPGHRAAAGHGGGGGRGGRRRPASGSGAASGDRAWSAGRSAVPRVVGVRTDGGDLAADLVVDAGGRPPAGRTGSPRRGRAAGRGAGRLRVRLLLPALPRPAPAEAGATRCSPTTRRSRCSRCPPTTAPRARARHQLPGPGAARAARPRPGRRRSARHPAAAHWLDGEPITDSRSAASRTGGAPSSRRPVVTGLVAVGDAWACTNPSLGRGISIGALHARVLRDRRQGGPARRPLVKRFHARRSAWSPVRRRDAASTGTGWPRSTPTSPGCRTGPTIPAGR